MDKGIYNATLHLTHDWMHSVYIRSVTGGGEGVRNTNVNVSVLRRVSDMRGPMLRKAVRVVIQFRKTYFDIH